MNGVKVLFVLFLKVYLSAVNAFLDSWVNIGVDELKVWQEEGGEMEDPESPHHWVANHELKVPELEDLDLGLIEICHTLEHLHVLQPRCLYHVSLESVFWNVPADVDEKAVRQQEAEEEWGENDLHFVDNSLLNILEGAFERNSLKIS